MLNLPGIEVDSHRCHHYHPHSHPNRGALDMNVEAAWDRGGQIIVIIFIILIMLPPPTTS